MIRCAPVFWLLVCAPAWLTGCGGAGTPACDPGRIECWHECVDPLTDRSNCGGCGRECGDGTFCQAGDCVQCQHACEPGQARCAGAGSLESCVADADTCMYWAQPVDCGEGYTCKYGACEPECADECPQEGQRRCSPDGGGLQTCTDEDSDGCLEWDAPITCGRCSECVVDACQATCTDECPDLGAVQCAGPTSYQACGDFDADEGWEWGPVLDCPINQTCDSGSCS